MDTEEDKKEESDSEKTPSGKKKIILDLTAFFLFLGILAGGIFFFRGRIEKLSKTVQEKRNLLTARSHQLGLASGIQKEYANAQPYINVLYTFLPEKDELFNLSREIQELARADGLEFGFSFTGESAGDNFTPGSVTFSLNVGGESMDKITSFIKRVQMFSHLIIIDSFSIVGKEGEDGFNASIKARAFYRPKV